MNASWQIAALGDVVRYRKEFIEINDLETYKRCRVKLHAQGVVLRDVARGAEIKTKKQQVCRAGEFLVAEIDAKVGGFGIVPPELDEAIVSSHYFLFGIDETKLNRRFLDFYIRTPSFRDQVTAQGSTNYAAVRPNEVLGYRLPLPPLEEQRRIIARIEELAAKIEEARGLRRETEQKVSSLISRTISQILDDEHWDFHILENVLAESPRNGLAPQAEVTGDGIPMLRINAVSSSPTRFVDTTACKLVSVTKEVAAPFTLKNDDVFIVRYKGDINRVARAGVFKSATPVLIVYPDKLMRLRPDQSKITADFLVYTLGCRSVRSQIEEMGKTTAGQIGVSGKDAKSFRIPVPPLEEQRRIVAYLDGLQAKVDTLKRLQAETAAELDALLPSVLDRAFRGEL